MNGLLCVDMVSNQVIAASACLNITYTETAYINVSTRQRANTRHTNGVSGVNVGHTMDGWSGNALEQIQHFRMVHTSATIFLIYGFAY